MRLVVTLIASFLLILVCSACAPPAGDGDALSLPATTRPTPGQQYLLSNIYFVRPDGGSPEQCTGLVDAPYPGSGTGQDCAWDHPFRALPPGGAPRLNCVRPAGRRD